jgi:hypothetical protein
MRAMAFLLALNELLFLPFNYKGSAKIVHIAELSVLISSVAGFLFEKVSVENLFSLFITKTCFFFLSRTQVIINTFRQHKLIARLLLDLSYPLTPENRRSQRLKKKEY